MTVQERVKILEEPTNDHPAEGPGPGPARADRTGLVLLSGVIAPLALFGSIAEEIAEQEKFSFD